MRYTKTHEWIDSSGKVGISDYAKKELGEVVYAELPKSGRKVKAGEQVCIIESTKVASEIYSPVSGTIKEVNPNYLADSSWLYRIEPSNPAELDQLLSEADYKKLVGG